MGVTEDAPEIPALFLPHFYLSKTTKLGIKSVKDCRICLQTQYQLKALFSLWFYQQ